MYFLSTKITATRPYNKYVTLDYISGIKTNVQAIAYEDFLLSDISQRKTRWEKRGSCRQANILGFTYLCISTLCKAVKCESSIVLVAVFMFLPIF